MKIPWLPLDEVDDGHDGDDGDDALIAPTRTVVSREQKTLVWHYTRHHILELILGSHTFQISNAVDMNDSAELRLGEKIMRKELKRLPHGWMDDPFDDEDIERLRDFHFEYSGVSSRGSAYVLSASRRGDDNAQWDRYAGWDGFAIGLPRGVMMPVLGRPAMSPTRDYVEEFPFRWADLIYRKARRQSAAADGWARVLGELREEDYASREWEPGSFFRDRAASEYVASVAQMKSRGYESERETRYFVRSPDNADVVGTRPSRFSAKAAMRYISITGNSGERFASVEHDPDYYQSAPSPLPIVAIRVGPHNDFGATERWLTDTLNATGYKGVKILRSKSTQRRAAQTDGQLR